MFMKPARDPHYRTWIRTLPCIVPGCRRRSHCAHTGGRGLSTKASDHDCVPICDWHHKVAPHCYHAGRRAFEQHYRISIREILEWLHRKPQMHLQSGEFVALFDAEDYKLGPVSQGAESALRKFKKIRLEMLG